ncbi:TRAP transporter small permease [uncultured Castellaniella sp.]|uniref:TRAP transporter small permease n=1 Tax=uncultured Castellaniella sp. TaxID=647907 RepID=UPI00260B641A|nr:TRAP transporter small permease [uncultured Castellaniella sp.]
MNSHTWSRCFLGIENALSRAAVGLATAGLGFAALCGLYQVVARFVLQRSAEWSEPLIQMTLIWMTYLGIAGALRSGTLISVDWLLGLSKGRMRHVVRGVILVCVLTLLGFIAWYGVVLALRVRFQTIAGLGIPTSWGYAALPVGAIVSMFSTIAHAMAPRADIDHQTQNT